MRYSAAFILLPRPQRFNPTNDLGRVAVDVSRLSGHALYFLRNLA